MELFTLFVKSFVWIAMSTDQLTTDKMAEYASCVAVASHQTGADPALIVSVITHESSWNENAISHTKDRGLGQIRCPSKWCSKSPTKHELDVLMNGCSNIRIVAEFLVERGIKGYNPGNPEHKVRVLGKRERLLRRLK